MAWPCLGTDGLRTPVSDVCTCTSQVLQSTGGSIIGKAVDRRPHRAPVFTVAICTNTCCREDAMTVIFFCLDIALNCTHKCVSYSASVPPLSLPLKPWYTITVNPFNLTLISRPKAVSMFPLSFDHNCVSQSFDTIPLYFWTKML